ncbi:MAG: multicopper oxidase family protein [Acidobacteriia bacterium]|nr:multicopper oxidase family protein [Terriglobia bacterium]
MDRRTFLQSAIANLGAVALGARISSAGLGLPGKPRQGTGSHPLDNPAVGAGLPREFPLILEKTQFEIPGRGVFEKWLYNGQFPGPEIRAKEGERLRIAVKNNLPEGTTVHWHGIPLQNAMDGVPDITQPAIPPGGTFVYEFDASPAGSYMYHSHVGLQQDRGLVGPLVLEEKNAHVAYDREYTLTLTDFLAGAPMPLGRMKTAGNGMMDMLAAPYIALLINGRPPEVPSVFQVKTGERVRLRLINPSGSSIYRFAIGGHTLMITHTDGRPVEPFRVDALRLGPGERYDVVVEARNPGAWPIAASADNDLPAARAVLQYTDSNPAMPREGAMPEGLTGGRLLQLDDLRGLDVPEVRKPNRIFNFVLAGGMLKPGGMMKPAGVADPGGAAAILTQQWTMNGQAYPNAEPLEIHRGEAVRIRLDNQSAMPHPMHLHGHFYRVGNVSKDTTIVWTHSKRVELDIVADNPGAWLFHCHNLYHMDGGMMRIVRYV